MWGADARILSPQFEKQLADLSLPLCTPTAPPTPPHPHVVTKNLPKFVIFFRQPY